MAINLKKVEAKFIQLKKDLPRVLGNDGQRFFTENFNKQGWEGEGFSPWKQVLRRMPGTKAYKYGTKSSRSRAILVGKGVLRRGVSRSLREARFNRIRFTVSVPYGGYHNDGTSKLPRRKFMGRSRILELRLKKKIEMALKRCFE